MLAPVARFCVLNPLHARIQLQCDGEQVPQVPARLTSSLGYTHNREFRHAMPWSSFASQLPPWCSGSLQVGTEHGAAAPAPGVCSTPELTLPALLNGLHFLFGFTNLNVSGHKGWDL